MNEFKKLTVAERNFRSQFQKDAVLVGEYTTSIVNAFKAMGLGDMIGNQVDRAEQKLKELDAAFDMIREDFNQLQAAGGGPGLDKLEKDLIDNRREAQALSASIDQVRADLRGMGSVGSNVVTSIAKGFKDLGRQIGQFVVGYIGFQALFQGLARGVSIAKELSDATTNLEINLNTAVGGADNLVKALAKLNTRTNLIGLEEIANVAARAGVSEKNLLGVTEALDKVKVSFGKDFGDVENGTETFAKLISIFHKDGEITGDRILKIGNAIRTLANETVASVPFINDFAGRMAGLKQISAISLADVIGLGAGFEEFKQSAEVASTALVRIIPKMATDIDKFSKIANQTAESFSVLLNSNPAEALLQVAEGLAKGKASVEEFATAMADSELPAARVTTILATLGGKADTFRERIRRASETIQETTEIEEAFRKKNENLAATLDKITKKFVDAAGSKGFQITVAAIAGVITILINNMGILVGLLTIYASVWSLANAQMLTARLTTNLLALSIKAKSAVMALASVFTQAYTASLSLFTAGTVRATVATRLLAIAIRLFPLGIAITVIALMIASMKALGGAVIGATKALNDQDLQRKINNDTVEKANKATADEISKLQTLVNVVTSTKTSYDTAKAALDELTSSHALFGTAMDGTIIKSQKLIGILDQVKSQILINAQAEASAGLSSDKYRQYLEIVSLRQKLERNLITGGGRPLDLTKDEREVAQKVPDIQSIRKSKGDIQVDGIRYDSKEYFAQLKKMENEALREYSAYNDFAGEMKTKKTKMDEQNATKLNFSLQSAEETRRRQAMVNKLSDEELSNLISGLDDQIKKLKEGDPKLAELQLLRKGFEERLNKLRGKEDLVRPGREYRGARLPGETKDDFSIIEARMNRELAIEETRIIEMQKIRELTFEEEREHLVKMMDIQVFYLSQKIALLGAQKNLNAKELETLAQFRKQRADIQLKTIRDLQGVDDKDFAERKTILKNNLDEEIGLLQDHVKHILEDPLTNETQRTQAKLNADRAILQMQEEYGIKLEFLEQQLGQKSIKSAKEVADMLRKIREEIRTDEFKAMEAQLKEVQAAGERQLVEFTRIIAAARLANQTKKQPESRRVAADAELARQEELGTIARELASLKIQLPQYKLLLANGRITYEVYLAHLEKIDEKQRALNDALEEDIIKAGDKIKTVKDLVQQQLGDLFNFKEGTKNSKALIEVIDQTFDLAGQAMADYFSRKEAMIQRDLKVTQDRIEVEKNIRLAQAQSRDEEVAIENQAHLKKEAAAKLAFEKDKKLKLQQAKINYLIQLSNIAVAASGNPLNAFTFGAAGILQYIIQAAIATAAYLINAGGIKSSTYAHGGNPDLDTIKGGRVRGQTHAQGGNRFIFKGRIFEDEVDELNIIRTKNAPKGKRFSISGTQEQIASALNEIGGGVKFAPGAKVKGFKHGGSINKVEHQAIERLNQERSSKIIVNNTFIGTDYRDDLSYLNKFIQIKNSLIDEKIVVAKQRHEAIDELLLQKIENKNYESSEFNRILKDNLTIENNVERINKIVENRTKNSSEVEVQAQKIIGAFNKLDYIQVNTKMHLETVDELNKAILTYRKLTKLPAPKLYETLQRFKTVKFSEGGSPDLNTVRGGRVKGRSHHDGGNPFIFRGRVFEDEVDELNIIRTKNVRENIVHTITGTHTQIASMLNQLGGGVVFRPGATIHRFESGGLLKAPVFTPASNAGRPETSIIDEIRHLAQEQSRRIDRLTVHQETSTVTTAQRKQVYQDQIGTL